VPYTHAKKKKRKKEKKKEKRMEAKLYSLSSLFCFPTPTLLLCLLTLWGHEKEELGWERRGG
jgi:hypothetical protein